MEELLNIFTVPDNTSMEEHSIVVDGGAIIGSHSYLGFGVIAESVIAGERVKINGNVIGTQEVRIDMWSRVGGDVRTKKDAYIGEFVNIDGKLIVEGDLDIGKDVKIKGGFEAKGWIVVRNPIPVIIYIFLYLTELLRMGKDEEVEKALEELFSDDSEDLNGERLLIIPGGSKIDLETIKVPDKAVIGSSCRMMGNIRASSLIMGRNNILFGSIKTMGEIVIGEGNTIHGNVVTRGNVRVDRGSHILGEINGGRIIVHEEARVDGAMRAPGGVIITRDDLDEVSKAGGLLEMVPEPLVKKTEKSKTEKSSKKSKKKAPKRTAAKKPADTATAKKTTTKPRTAKSGTKLKYNIPKKRLITAVRLSDVEKSVETRKKSATKKTATKKKSAAKKTAAKKTSTKKKSTTEKSSSKRSGKT